LNGHPSYIGYGRGTPRWVECYRRPPKAGDEFYYNVHNERGSPVEVPERNIRVTEQFAFTAPAQTHRFSDIYISFFAVNIGSVRAENIVFTLDGIRPGKLDYRKIFGHQINQMAPGQSVYLMRLGQRDLYPNEGAPPDITLTAAYYAVPSILKWPHRMWAKLRKRSQYSTDFVFNGRNIATDLPPPQYNG
jgi:hypothetical protein